ncbi:hypothetical protein BDR26DRAFT_923786 [Obelidium mucronatum]|nr:hypothetical protein BDR26DRAFT_923786 [Obelidium mucronatum]
MSFIDEARAVVVLANDLRKVKPFLHRYKSAVKLYDNNNRMRAICDHISKQFSLTNEKVFTLAERVFQCPGMDAVHQKLDFQQTALNAAWYNVDSVTYMSEDKQKQLIEMYPLETILVKLYREQRTYSLAFPTIKVPDPDSAVIFKRGFYVYHMLLLQQYISKIPANDDYEHMRYSHFRPSWAPKTTHLWNNSRSILTKNR